LETAGRDAEGGRRRSPVVRVTRCPWMGCRRAAPGFLVQWVDALGPCGEVRGFRVVRRSTEVRKFWRRPCYLRGRPGEITARRRVEVGGGGRGVGPGPEVRPLRGSEEDAVQRGGTATAVQGSGGSAERRRRLGRG